MIDERSIKGTDDAAFEAACKAFSIGPPGVLRRVQQHDSYPGERIAPDDPPDPDAYPLIKTTLRDERAALAEAINAYLKAVTPPGINVTLTPSRNEIRYEHVGCDDPFNWWLVPLDDCDAPVVGEVAECARCCHQVKVHEVRLTEDIDWKGAQA